MNHPAIGMIETNSIARGILVHDVMLKKAQMTDGRDYSSAGLEADFLAGINVSIYEK